MSRIGLPVCLLCEHHLQANSHVLGRSWQPTRFASQLQRRRTPSRMVLSPRVGRTTDRPSKASKPENTSRNSPFGGMNVTSTNIPRTLNKPSDMQMRRTTRGEYGHKKSEEKEKSSFHALRMQQSLATVPYTHRNNVKSRIAEIDTFEQFDLLPIIADSIGPQALKGLEELVPTPIQRLAIPALLGQAHSRDRRPQSNQPGMEQVLIAAETGTGKTMAYLLPILNAIKIAEQSETTEKSQAEKKIEQLEKNNPYYVEPPTVDQPHSTTGRPRAIILLPTSELVTQVISLVKLFSHTVKFRSAAISSSYTPKVIRNRIFSPQGIDILVSTPHLLESITASDPNILSRVKHLVIDEADSLMDRSFAPITSAIIDKTTPSLKQLIMCSATIPRSLDQYLRDRFPDMRRLVTPNLHAIPRRVQLGVVDVEKDLYKGNKDIACADTIHSIGKAAGSTSAVESSDPFELKRILVFVNEREKTVELAEYLQSKGIDAEALNRDTPEQRQSELLSLFTTQPVRPKDTSGGFTASFSPEKTFASTHRRLKNVKVMVTTDLGSRGIDTLAVRTVILYDVPHSTIDFIHRLGRTGRMGRRGRGIVLVGKHDRRDVVREVKENMFKGQALI